MNLGSAKWKKVIIDVIQEIAELYFKKSVHYSTVWLQILPLDPLATFSKFVTIQNWDFNGVNWSTQSKRSGELRQESWKTVELHKYFAFQCSDPFFPIFFILNQINMASKTVPKFRFIGLFYSASEVQLTFSRSNILKIASNQCISSKDWWKVWIVGRGLKKAKFPQHWGV